MSLKSRNLNTSLWADLNLRSIFRFARSLEPIVKWKSHLDKELRAKDLKTQALLDDLLAVLHLWKRFCHEDSRYVRYMIYGNNIWNICNIMRKRCLGKSMPENMKVSTESGKLTAMTSEAANVRRRRQQTGFRFRVMAFTDSSWQSTTMSNCHTVSEECSTQAFTQGSSKFSNVSLRSGTSCNNSP